MKFIANSLQLALLALLAPSPILAQYVTPDFTQGSSTSTTTTTSNVTETIVTERLAGAYHSVSGTNVTASGPLLDPATTYTMTAPGSDFQIESTIRAAGIVETETINRTIDMTSTTSTMSVFSK